MKRTVLITGGNTGIGLATARELCRQGLDVMITCRHEVKARATAELLLKETGVSVKTVVLDLSKPASVRQAAIDIKRQTAQLDVLINNAGGYFSNLELNVNGLEMTFASNHLGTFLLTSLLLDLLLKSDDARVINVASVAHKSTKVLDLDDINYKKQRYQGWMSYSRSKFCNILMARELAARYGNAGLLAFSLHPGGVRTQIAEKNANWYTALGWILAKPFFISVERGAATSIYLATAPRAELLPHNGAYYHKCKHAHGNRPSQNMETAYQLWQRSEQLCAL